MCANAGTRVIATSREASKEKTIVRANGLNSSPTIPLTKASGRNTAIVTIVEDMIGTNISRVASIMSLLPFNFSFFSDKRR
ncbi:hypothetical protein D3C81_1488970 [compost metagenome]